ncbi:acyl-CoA dehydrogenase family protein [Actinoplanes sp. N902-109]|uniref:acyl-CoA dehydrogenase family protein n=1 Tax=Actinoplanes sp. (strain N902-109) TaxID=649831 RepID=UPI0003293F03|nr:acyl-CoA dehydrogenase family protein [Actinoplanes sp. N902-109]AGL21589.1 hydroxylase [Actinoplanes sp. N902-109]
MSTSLLDGVRALGPSIRDLAPDIERDRAVPAAVIEQLTKLGIFRLTAPAAAGGLEADPATLVRVFEELGHADGSTGWCAMIGGATGIALGYLPPATATELLADPRFLIAGVAAPTGRATPVDGGFRVSGRWAFASGCRHATWLVGGALTPAGPRLFILDPAELTFHDTWHVAGLRGTGSHDFSADAVFVPESRTFSLAEPPTQPGALYRFPAVPLLSVGIGAVALGIARAAIADFADLSRSKLNPMTGEPLATRPAARVAMAEATAAHGAGMAYLLHEVGAAVPVPDMVRLAVITATRNAARAVDLVYAAAGGSAVYESSPLQRHFRDVHAATQHAMVSAEVLENIGKALL